VLELRLIEDKLLNYFDLNQGFLLEKPDGGGVDLILGELIQHSEPVASVGLAELAASSGA